MITRSEILANWEAEEAEAQTRALNRAFEERQRKAFTPVDWKPADPLVEQFLEEHRAMRDGWLREGGQAQSDARFMDEPVCSPLAEEERMKDNSLMDTLAPRRLSPDDLEYYARERSHTEREAARHSDRSGEFWRVVFWVEVVVVAGTSYWWLPWLVSLGELFVRLVTGGHA